MSLRYVLYSYNTDEIRITNAYYTTSDSEPALWSADMKTATRSNDGWKPAPETTGATKSSASESSIDALQWTDRCNFQVCKMKPVRVLNLPAGGISSDHKSVCMKRHPLAPLVFEFVKLFKYKFIISVTSLKSY